MMRWRWSVWLVVIIGAGLLSRWGRTGWVVVDKYLGDALYAAMVYVLLRLGGRRGAAWGWAGLIMVAVEAFQLTGIPAAMVRSEAGVVRVCGRLLGTQFSVWDLAAYAVGIAGI